jgi:hypothetical protein
VQRDAWQRHREFNGKALHAKAVSVIIYGMGQLLAEENIQ